MERVEKYAKWLVDNQNLKGTPEFETVSQAYKALRSDTSPKLGGTAGAAPAEAPIGDFLNRAGGMIPFADEIRAGAAALPALFTDEDFSDQYQAYKQADLERGQRIEQEMNPAMRVAADTLGLGASLAGGGALTQAAGLTKAVPTGAERFGQAVAAGGLYGGVSGASEGESLEERAENAAIGAGIGGMLGGGVQSAASGLAKLGDRIKAPTIKVLRGQEKNLWKVFDQENFIVKQPAVKRVADRVAKEMGEFRLGRQEPKSRAIAKDIVKLAKDNTTIKEYQGLRRDLNKVIGSHLSENSDREAARRMRNILDDTVLKPGWLSPAEANAPNPDRAIGVLRQALDVSKRRIKAEKIEKALTKARAATGQFTVAGYENAVRREFQKLARRLADNPAGWTKEEITAIQMVGNGAPMANLMRYLGKFAPNHPIYAFLGGSAAYSAAGPVGVGALLGAATLGKGASNVMTQRAAENASRLVRGGGAPPPQLPVPNVGMLGGAMSNPNPTR